MAERVPHACAYAARVFTVLEAELRELSEAPNTEAAMMLGYFRAADLTASFRKQVEGK